VDVQYHITGMILKAVIRMGSTMIIQQLYRGFCCGHSPLGLGQIKSAQGHKQGWIDSSCIIGGCQLFVGVGESHRAAGDLTRW
jgi:hypothetical protein